MDLVALRAIITHTLSKVLVGLLTGILAAAPGPVASTEPTFETFQEVCLKTANHPGRFSREMQRLDGWEPMSPDDLVVMTELESNQTWHLQGAIELGIVVSGRLPQGAGRWTGLSLCMLAMPRHALTVEDASQFLQGLGGLRATPAVDDGDSGDIFFAYLLEDNWMMVGAHILPSGTHLQFLLTDVPDEMAKAAIDRAKALNAPAI